MKRKAKKAYSQQHNCFHQGERSKDRIVGPDKDHIRPIVRGKETLKWVHIAISNAKRNFAGTYHKIKAKYLQL